ncbi:MAG: DUF2332 domain-containing protein [Hyphomicrobiales bacterium]
MSPTSDSTDPPTDAIREAFFTQAKWCRKLGSLFTARVCLAGFEILDRTSKTGALILDWTGNPAVDVDALAARFAGAIHAMKLQGNCPALERIFPPNEVSESEFKAGLREAIAECDGAIAKWLELPPQTNEVARSAVLMAGLLHVSAQTGLPCALYELGTSAGLNLMVDHYGYQLGGLKTGNNGSKLQLSPQWEGPPAPSGNFQIAARCGVDIAPLDVTLHQDRLRLLAYIWADQPERLGRMRAAIDIARQVPPQIDKASAEEWLETMLAKEPEEGICRVVMHTIAFHYFPELAQEKILSLLENAGSRADAKHPLAWFRFDLDVSSNLGGALNVRLWPDGTDQLLACADPHVKRIEWFKK